MGTMTKWPVQKHTEHHKTRSNQGRNRHKEITIFCVFRFFWFLFSIFNYLKDFSRKCWITDLVRSMKYKYKIILMCTYFFFIVLLLKNGCVLYDMRVRCFTSYLAIIYNWCLINIKKTEKDRYLFYRGNKTRIVHIWCVHTIVKRNLNKARCFIQPIALFKLLHHRLDLYLLFCQPKNKEHISSWPFISALE